MTVAPGCQRDSSVLLKVSFFCFKLSNLMDKQVLTSSLAAEDAGCYTVGILRQGKIVIRICLKCPCDQKLNSYFSLDFKTMLTKH